MKYRDYAKKNVPERTDAQIEEAVSGLFGADAEMGEPIEHSNTFELYLINGYYFYMNFSSCDTVETRDDDGNVLESWILDY